jgi:peptidoglycan/xylan/chitin deacetylase (PgdA/CDA1 family)
MLIRSVATRIHRAVLGASHRRLVALRDSPPMVSFTFDDFPRSAYLVGGQTLAAHGVRGTYYAAPGLMGTTGELGELFCAQDVLDLVAAGHELASHTLHHVSSRTMSADEYAAEVVKGDDALRQVVSSGPSGNFSYPFGEVTVGAKKVAGQHCRSCRSTLAGYHGPTADLNFLRANQLYSSSIPFSRVAELVARHARPGHWLIFYTHDVRDTPSRYGCTPQYFEDSVRCAVEAGARVVTVADALASLEDHRLTGAIA